MSDIYTALGIGGGAVPAAHAPTHESGGTDPIPLDTLAVPTDNITLNVSMSAHGLQPKLPGGTSTFMRADGTYAAPNGGVPTNHAAMCMAIH